MASTVIQTILLKDNLLNHYNQDTLHQDSLAIMYFYILQPISSMAVTIGRISVAILLLRLVGRSTWTKILLHSSIISTLLLSVLYSIVIFFNCKPVAAAWTPHMPGSCTESIQELSLILGVLIASTHLRTFMTVRS